MTGKEFLFSLNRDKLIDQFYEDYYEGDLMFDEKAKKEGFADKKKEVIRMRVNRLMADLAKTKTVKADEFMILPLPYYDFDFDDDDDEMKYSIKSDYDICLVKREDFSDRQPMPKVERKEDIPSQQLFETYAMMFISWDELMSYEMLYVPESEEDRYGSAAYFLYELSWYGFDRETAEKNEAEDKKKLDEAVEEAKDPENLTEFSLDDFREELGIAPPSKEREELFVKLTSEMAVKNYNEHVDVYNKYMVGRAL